MTDSYKVGYSVDALDDLREIYSYIANELLVPETAAALCRTFCSGRFLTAVVNFFSIASQQNLLCISRPRRFGKSYAAKMLVAYYDRSCDSHALFDDEVAMF